MIGYVSKEHLGICKLGCTFKQLLYILSTCIFVYVHLSIVSFLPNSIILSIRSTFCSYECTFQSNLYAFQFFVAFTASGKSSLFIRKTNAFVDVESPSLGISLPFTQQRRTLKSMSLSMFVIAVLCAPDL